MKKLIPLLLLTFCLSGLKAQILKPVSWSYAAKKTGSNTATLFIKATIDEGWHLYSQFVKEGGPVKTTFSFAPSKNYTLIGTTIEPKPITKMEPVFKMNVSFFERSVIFQQKIKFTGKPGTIKGKVEFMVCDDKQCLPPDEVEFTVAIK